jgi:adenylate kinase family enzyme
MAPERAPVSLFVVLVGHNGSGKTTLAKKLEEDLGINVVSGDPLRLLMKREIKYFNDFDISIPTDKGRGTNLIINTYRHQLSRLLLENNQAVIYDSNALKKSDRAEIIHKVTAGIDSVTTVIIRIYIPEEELLERLQNRSEPNWLEHYMKHKKPTFEMPTADEADHLLVYDQKNYEEIKETLYRLMA